MLFQEWGLNLNAGNCSSGEQCGGVNPANGGECEADEDCLVYGGYETINPQCVNGHCGASFCSPQCDENWSCSGGWLPLYTGSSCICRPPFQSLQPETCNIGRQPRLDLAKQRVDELVDEVLSNNPELTQSAGVINDERIVNLRNNKGVGIVCPEITLDPENHTYEVGDGDIVCEIPTPNDDDLWPKGVGIAKTMDLNADGRAELVSWHRGEFKIDLSTVGETSDHFGTWDLIVSYPKLQGKWVWAVC